MGVWVLAPSYLDSLGLGALLSIYLPSPHAARRLLIIGCAGLLIWMMSRLPVSGLDILYYYELESLGPALFFTWLIAAAASGFSGFAGRLLGCRELVYLGKISYGMYLIHNFLPGFVYTYLTPSLSLCALYSTILTAVLASLTYHLIERPLAKKGRIWFKKNGARIKLLD